MRTVRFVLLSFSIFVLSNISASVTLAQRVSLVSVNRNQTASGNNQTLRHKMSGNGRYVVFESEASDLVLGDSNGAMDVFRRDLVTGTTQLVSITPGGTSGNGPSYNAGINADGSSVVFTSEASDLISTPPNGPADTNGLADVFIRSFPPVPNTICIPLCTSLVSVNRNGTASSNGTSHSPSISADGFEIAFRSNASDLIPGNPPGTPPEAFHIFLRTSGNAGSSTALITVPVKSPIFCQGSPTPVDTSPVISPNGLFVAFASFASNLTTEDDMCDSSNNANDSDIFVYSRIANTLRLASIARTNLSAGNGRSTNPVVANDGTVAFLSTASDLVNNDTNNQRDVFTYRAISTLTLVSINMSGTDSGNGASQFPPTISTDGRIVAFESSADNLVPSDTNQAGDVFVRDLMLNTTSLASSNTSGGTLGDGLNSFNPIISANGRFVAFSSRHRPLDRAFPFPNGNFHVYVRDLRARHTTLVSVNRDNSDGGNFGSLEPQISSDGSSISFVSNATNLVSVNDNDSADIYTLRRTRRPTDYDDDGRTDIAVYRPSNGTWFISRSSDNAIAAQPFGLSGDIPVPADYDGDNLADLAVFRPSEGIWYVLQSSNQMFWVARFGLSGDKPVAADFDGDGRADVAVYRPSEGIWYILNSSNDSFRTIRWGLSDDKPVPVDYDGDGRADLAVFRPSTGVWYIINSGTSAFAVVQWGISGDKPVAGDYDGDGRADIAVWRPSSGVWYVLRSSNNSLLGLQWGISGDVPQPGDFDGDNRNDFVVWRPSQTTWYVLRSSNFSVTTAVFGISSDLPVSSPFLIE